MDKNCRDDQHPLPTVRPTDFVCQPGGSDVQLTSESLPYVMVQLSLCVRGHRVGAASSVCYACHWRGMGRPKPTQAATWRRLVCDESGGREPAQTGPPPPRWRPTLLNATGMGRVWSASTPPVTKPGDRWGSWVPFPGQLQAHVIASSRLTLTEYAELVLGDEFKVFRLPNCCRSADCRQPKLPSTSS